MIPMSDPDGTPELLTPDEQAVWRGFLSWSEIALGLIGRELSTATGLSVPDFEVLVRLYEAPEHTLTQRALGRSLGWSASRLSHQLARMQARNLVRRRSAGTGRLLYIDLVEGGRTEIVKAVRVHAAAVRAHFLAPLGPEVRRTFTALGDAASPPGTG
jgi:DNA-binding MarR family transcriptional regulator